MNRLKERRQALGLTQPQVARCLREVEPRINGPMVSRYEQGVCLPTREQLAQLEAVLQASRSALYDAEDLALGSEETGRSEPAKGRDRHRAGNIRKCYRVPKEFMAQIPEDILSMCGYPSWNAWHAAALKRLLGEYAARCKGRRRNKNEVV